MSAAKVVIIGGGFAGLNVAWGLRRADAEVTLIDRRNFHLFQPLLYQVATGGLSPANIASPLRGLLRRVKNAQILLGRVTEIDPVAQQVYIEQTGYSYDFLVIAAGAKSSYFGNDHWAATAPGLKTIEDATEIRARILNAFELAEQQSSETEKRKWMTFVIVGGGPTGVELAGAISELARQTLKNDFRKIDPREARIVLVDAGQRVLSSFDPSLCQKAHQALERLGVEVRTQLMVTNIEADSVSVQATGQATQTIPTHTVLWAAGVQAVGLANAIAQQTGCPQDRAGRLMVRPDLSLPNFPNAFAIGDIAHCVDWKRAKPNGVPATDAAPNLGSHQAPPLPGVAPVAIQQGKYVAKLIRENIRGGDRQPFEYHSPGNLATIGRRAAVAEIGRFKFSGYFAWVLWAIVHILQISLMENRLLVFLQWAWNYVTFNRSARLITSSPIIQPDTPTDRPSAARKSQIPTQEIS